MMKDSQMVLMPQKHEKQEPKQEVEDASSMCESEVPHFAQGMEMFSQFKQFTNN